MVTFTASRKAGFFLSGDPEKEAGKNGEKAAITKGVMAGVQWWKWIRLSVHKCRQFFLITGNH
ncbi:hypothetical protein, partial [Klebsiella pneumoniae]|uniref:hypothetical protein n=1 Tax=Klebsiella pneumoniae TaxID=573 RepID=UPI001CDD6A1B